MEENKDSIKDALIYLLNNTETIREAIDDEESLEAPDAEPTKDVEPPKSVEPKKAESPENGLASKKKTGLKQKNRARHSVDVSYRLACFSFILGCFGIFPGALLAGAISLGYASRAGAYKDTRKGAARLLSITGIILGIFIFIVLYRNLGSAIDFIVEYLKNNSIPRQRPKIPL